MNSKRSFFDAINFLYIFGKCFGISCYSISKGRIKYKVSVGMSDFIYFVSFSGVIVTLIYYNLQLEFNNNANNTRIFNQAQQIIIICSLLFLLGGLFQILLMRQTFWDIANTLNEIDNQMMKLLKIEIDHNLVYQCTVIHTCISFSALVVVYTIFGYYSLFMNTGIAMVAQYISYVIINGQFSLLTIQFQVFLFSMYMRFSTLNGFVESNILSQTHHLKFQLLMSSKLQANIISIATITDQLNNLVPLLTRYFFTFIASSVLGVFCLTVFSFHSLYRVISENQSFEFYILVISYELIGLMFNILVGLSIAISARNSCTAKGMGVLVHKIISRTHDQQFILKLKILSLQVLHSSPNFSFGVISMNWQFSFSYVASVASYLFILIQFQMHG